MCWLPHKTVVINAAPTNEGAFVLMGCVKQTFRFFSLVAGTKKRLCVFATEHKNDFRTDRKFYVFTFMCFMFCVFVFLGMLQCLKRCKPKTQQTRAIFISFSFQQQHGEGKSEQGHHRRDRECSKCIIIAMILTILSFYPQNAESYSSLSYAVHHRGALRTRRPSLYNASRLGPRHSGAR